ncbi:DUF6069 family protein [Nonomuraea sp. NPDC050451]|uniref:DUF6069 family protein n=1 Tax=Nonomuraea sp. NPDC050451 TaxID=3364364 RepID=UPI00379BF9A3
MKKKSFRFDTMRGPVPVTTADTDIVLVNQPAPVLETGPGAAIRTQEAGRHSAEPADEGGGCGGGDDGGVFAADALLRWQRVPAGLLRFGVVLCAAFGSVLAVGVVRRAAPPQQTFVRVALAVTTVWFALQLALSHTTTSARLLLAGGHVRAAAIVISGLTWAIRRAPRQL